MVDKRAGEIAGVRDWVGDYYFFSSKNRVCIIKLASKHTVFMIMLPSKDQTVKSYTQKFLKNLSVFSIF